MDTATAIPGLFVAGEDAGGVHGANRLGGNGVANSTVYGGIAGDVMAEFVASEGAFREPDMGAAGIMLEGRFMMGIGPGATPPDFEMFKIMKAFMPAPVGDPPPSPFAWGNPTRLRELLGEDFELAFEPARSVKPGVQAVTLAGTRDIEK